MMKSHRIKLAITGFIALMGIATAAYAQSAAEIGAMHNNCNHPNYQGDRSRCGGGNREPVYTEVWEDRYGAIAVDHDTGNAGVIEAQKSKRQAESIAVKNCAVKSCKVVSSIRNGCHAVAWGGGYSNYGNGVEEAQAITHAMKICATTSNSCEIKYSGCSLPVRVK